MEAMSHDASPNVRLKPPPRRNALREPQATIAAVGCKAWFGVILISTGDPTSRPGLDLICCEEGLGRRARQESDECRGCLRRRSVAHRSGGIGNVALMSGRQWPDQTQALVRNNLRDCAHANVVAFSCPDPFKDRRRRDANHLRLDRLGNVEVFKNGSEL